jgi:hypothetical protein
MCWCQTKPQAWIPQVGSRKAHGCATLGVPTPRSIPVSHVCTPIPSQQWLFPFLLLLFLTGVKLVILWSLPSLEGGQLQGASKTGSSVFAPCSCGSLPHFFFKFFISFFLFLFFFYSYVHTMFGSFLPPLPTPPLPPSHPLPLSPTPSIPDRNYFALISNFVVERI